mmetsp:Transcript_109240/g.352616  ORF Transcript_109240/g.352616 Transcript_109240/m.352616 type:complete len:227 (-) Transcript_109240:301-981(-)
MRRIWMCCGLAMTMQAKRLPWARTFFQTADYGWRSVAAWFKSTNRVISGCGSDLFDQSYQTQTKCILSRVVDRQEAYNVVGRCMAAAATTSYAATAFPTSAPSPMPTQAQTSAAPISTSASPTTTVGSACAPVFECGAEFSWCDNAKLVAFCSAGDASGQCPPTWCRQGLAEPDPEPEPEPEVVALQATAGRPKSKGQSFLGMALLQAGKVMERATTLAWEELGEL